MVEKQPVAAKKNRGSRYGDFFSTFDVSSSSELSAKTKKTTLCADALEFCLSSWVYDAATTLVQVVNHSSSVGEETTAANDLDMELVEDTQNMSSINKNNDEPSLVKKEDPSFVELELTQEEEDSKEDVVLDRIKQDECAYYLMGKCTGGRKKKRRVTWLWKWWNDWWTVETIPRCRFGYHEEDRLYCSICCYVIQDNVHKFHYRRCFEGLAEDDPRRLKLLKMAEEQSK
jgi:hypothetical protein